MKSLAKRYRIPLFILGIAILTVTAVGLIWKYDKPASSQTEMEIVIGTLFEKCVITDNMKLITYLANTTPKTALIVTDYRDDTGIIASYRCDSKGNLYKAGYVSQFSAEDQVDALQTVSCPHSPEYVEEIDIRYPGIIAIGWYCRNQQTSIPDTVAPTRP